MDKSGTTYNSWNSPLPPGMSVHLLPNGNLLRTESTGNNTCGYPGGRVAMYNWADSLLWSYNIDSGNLNQSHDAYPLPNGNVLVDVWEFIPESEVLAVGRNVCLDVLSENKGIWSAMVIELQQNGTSATNVWQWRFWDHLISSSIADTIAANPQLLNINFVGTPNSGTTDWIHMNAVSYNAALDQIMVSSRNLNEIYIIDHSTTTAEAASHSGGIYGKGGDFLYRWGNPASYSQGNYLDQQFFGQHSPYWLDTTDVNSSQIMINNDGFDGIFDADNCSYTDGPRKIATTFNIVDMPYNSSTLGYDKQSNNAYGPLSPSWTGTAPSPTYWNEFEGSVQLLSNGNILIDAALEGIFYEMDTTSNEIVWQYNFAGGAFRCHQYDSNYINSIMNN